MAFNVGLIGGGTIAGAHVEAAKASARRVRIATVVDPSDQACRRIADATGAMPYASIEELLAAESRERTIHGLVVCTPPNVRLGIVKPALERGIPVLVEKPLAATVAGARALAEIAGSFAKVPALVGYCHRFVPAVVEMRKRIADGSLGTILRFENTFAGPNPGMQSKWMSDPAISGGGSFVDTGSHSLDLYSFLLGPAKVHAAIFNHHWPGRGESNATVLVRASGIHEGAAGVIQSGWLEPGRFTLSVVGTEGLLHYDYEKPTELLYRTSQGKDQTLRVESHEVRFERQLISFAEIAAGAANSHPQATFRDGLRIAEMAEQATKCAQEG